MLGSVLSFAGPVIGGLLGGKASKDAASTQAAAAQAGAALQKKQFETTRRDLAPWKSAGAGALDDLNNLVSRRGRLMQTFGREDFETDPGYQFRAEEGRKGIENSAAARGMQLSGAALKGMERYRQGIASDEYGRAWGRDAAEKDRQITICLGSAGRGWAPQAGPGSSAPTTPGAPRTCMGRGPTRKRPGPSAAPTH